MARIRSIKPEAFKSESLSHLDYFTRWTFAGLWTYLDDHGYGRGDVRLIRAEVFPLDDDATVAKVTKALDALHANGSVCRFTVDGRDYIHSPKWTDHQKVSRPTKSKIPQCPEHGEGVSGVVAMVPTVGAMENIADPMENSLGTGNREQGTGKRSATADAERLFDSFWSDYPRKDARAAALKAWVKALKKVDAGTITDGLRKHLPVWAKGDAQFIPFASTWLNGERWADDVEPVKPRDNRPEGW